jgi:hypothetical protein
MDNRKGCKYTGRTCPNCGKIHLNKYGSNNSMNIPGVREKHMSNVPNNLNLPQVRNNQRKMMIDNNPAKRPEIRKKLSLIRMGYGNGNWKGGKSFEPYSSDFNAKLKKEILKRDNEKCQFDNGYKDSPYKSTHKGVLCIHHIDYDKKNSKPMNLITLCARHNSIVNKVREYWTKYFRDIMSGRLV